MKILFRDDRGYQVRCVSIGTSPAQLRNNFPFYMGLTYSAWPDDRFLTDKRVSVSTICVGVGMFPSKKEFHRKLKAGAVFYWDSVISEDVFIDAEHPSIFHEVRFGRKCLEIIVSPKISRWRAFLDWIRYRLKGFYEGSFLQKLKSA